MQWERLSTREVEILELAHSGLKDPEIAKSLGIQVTTVRTFWVRLRTKLGEASKTKILTAYSRRTFDEQASALSRYRSLSAHYGIAVTALRNGFWVVTIAGEGFAALTGASPIDIEGKPLKDLFPVEDQGFVLEEMDKARRLGSHITKFPFGSRDESQKALTILTKLNEADDEIIRIFHAKDVPPSVETVDEALKASAKVIK